MVGFWVHGSCHGVVARHADIASDAFANVVDVSVLDLFGQEGIGDGGAGSPIMSRTPRRICDTIGIRRRKAANADQRRCRAIRPVDELRGQTVSAPIPEGREVIAMLAECRTCDVNVSDWSNDSKTSCFRGGRGIKKSSCDSSSN